MDRRWNLAHLPPRLTLGRFFVVWNEEQNGARIRKVPYIPHRPRIRASVSSSATWGSFQDAMDAVASGVATGIGRVLGDGLIAVDLDDCRDPRTGAIQPTAQKIVSTLDTYTEISPSGTGLHSWCIGELPPGGNRSGKVEMYAVGRYMTLTGYHLDGTPSTIARRFAEIKTVHAEYFSHLRLVDTAERDDSALISRAMSARNGEHFSSLWRGDTTKFEHDGSRADLALCRLLAYWTRDDATRIHRQIRQSGLMRQKWDEQRGSATYGWITIGKVLKASSTDDADQHPGSTPSRALAPSTQHARPPNQATEIVGLVLASGAELFPDDDQRAHIDMPIDGHHETYELRSSRARRWIEDLFYTQTGRVPGGQAIADAMNLLDARARRKAPRTVAVRVGVVADTVYLDLCDPLWRVVEIDRDGWRVIGRTPLPFRRTKSMQSLPIPESGGSLDDLREFLNLGTEDDFILTVSPILAALRGRKPYPIIVLNGEQGSAKSTTTALIRALVDPNTAPLRAEPHDVRDLMIAATNAHLLSFDNLSHVRLADELCRLATGGGFSTRTLFENREEEIFSAAKPIILNGIPELATRPDLIARSILLTLPPISGSARRDEAEFWASFERCRPKLLGALLDVLTVGLRNLPGVSLPSKPRMADFAMFMVAAEPACPWPPAGFVQAYAANRGGAVAAALDGDIIGDTALALGSWEGTATAFLTEVNSRATEDQRRQRDWYTKPRQVRDALQRLAPALRESGVEVVLGLKDNTRSRRRLIRLERRGVEPSDPSGASETAVPSLAVDGRTRHTDDAPSGSSSEDPVKQGSVPDDADDPDVSERSDSDDRTNDE